MTITYRFYASNCEYDEVACEFAPRLIATKRLECDAQAEMWVNNLRDEGKIPNDMDGNPVLGLIIKRGDVEWFSRGV